MGFIYEEMSQEDLEFIKKFNFQNQLSRTVLKPINWTVDREKNAFLIALGGQGYYGAEIPMFYAFVWKNKVIKIEAFEDGHGNAEDGINKWWKLNKIVIPDIFIKHQQLIIELIKEAFIAKSKIYSIDCVKSITFDYIAQPSFVKEVQY